VSTEEDPMGAKKKTRSNYPPAFKVRLLDEAKTESAVAVAKRNGVSDQSIYLWRAKEKELRALAAKEPEATKPTNGATNGHSMKEDPKPKLTIVGLTPLIEQLISSEIKKTLGPLVEKTLGEVVAKELQKRFQ
jgi:transposase-like protein